MRYSIAMIATLAVGGWAASAGADDYYSYSDEGNYVGHSRGCGCSAGRHAYVPSCAGPRCRWSDVWAGYRAPPCPTADCGDEGCGCSEDCGCETEGCGLGFFDSLTACFRRPACGDCQETCAPVCEPQRCQSQCCQRESSCCESSCCEPACGGFNWDFLGLFSSRCDSCHECADRCHEHCGCGHQHRMHPASSSHDGDYQGQSGNIEQDSPPPLNGIRELPGDAAEVELAPPAPPELQAPQPIADPSA